MDISLDATKFEQLTSNSRDPIVKLSVGILIYGNLGMKGKFKFSYCVTDGGQLGQLALKPKLGNLCDIGQHRWSTCTLTVGIGYLERGSWWGCTIYIEQWGLIGIVRPIVSN